MRYFIIGFLLLSLNLFFINAGVIVQVEDNSDKFISNLPVELSTENISLVNSGAFQIYDGSQIKNVQYRFYRNNSYKCGKSGNYTFASLQLGDSQSVFSQKTTQWYYLHGGGVSYCALNSANQKSCSPYVISGHDFLSESDFSFLKEKFLNQAANKVGSHFNLKQTYLAQRLKEKKRITLLTMCDHDTYGGLGQVFSNNPFRENDRVEGLLASLSAVKFVSSAFPHNGQIYLSGSSAGGDGAYYLMLGLLNQGFKPKGVVIDAAPSIAQRNEVMMLNGLTPISRMGDSLGLTPQQSLEQLGLKLGVFVSRSEYQFESNILDLNIPMYIMVGSNDEFCGGSQAAIPDALADGFSNNCRWSYQPILDKVSAKNSPLHKVYLVQGAGHVVGGLVDSSSSQNQANIEKWLKTINQK